MKDSEEKEHRISNLKDMIDNIKEEDTITEIEDIEEDSELINYLNENEVSLEELEIDDEFIYHPGDEDDSAVNLEENIDEDFIIKTPKVSEKATDTEETDMEELDEDISNEITENFDNILNAKIGRTPILGVASTVIGLILIVIAAINYHSRSDKIVDNVASGEAAFIFVILLIIGLLFLIYGLYKVIGFKNPLSNLSKSIDSIESDDEKTAEMETPENVIPKSNIPLDKESYKIGEFDFDDLKNNLKKPKTASKPQTTPTEDNINDIPPAREKPKEKKGLTSEEIEEIEYEQAILDNESIDDIFAEVEEIEDIPIISIDSKENKKE